MKTYVRLVRRVARANTRCDQCPWIVAPLSPVFEPTIGGVALGRYCNQAHAELAMTAPLEVQYQ